MPFPFQMTLGSPVRSQVAQSADRHVWGQESNPDCSEGSMLSCKAQGHVVTCQLRIKSGDRNNRGPPPSPKAV